MMLCHTIHVMDVMIGGLSKFCCCASCNYNPKVNDGYTSIGMNKISPDEAVLGLLAEKPCHGYQLLAHFRESALGPIWKLSTSHLYTILKRLERRGEIDGREVGGDTAPIRTEYWLTPAGEKRLRRWLNEQHPLPGTRHIRTAFLSRLYIAQLIGAPLQPIIRAQKSSCQNYRQALLAMQSQSGIEHLSTDLLASELDAIIAWFDRCEAALADGARLPLNTEP